MKKELNNVTGSCLCGKVSYRLKGEAEAFYFCHCLRCRKSTGSAHASNIFTAIENIEWLAGEEHIKRYEIPEAKSFSKQFCSNCGSGVPYINRAGTKLIIPAGSITSKIDFPPDYNIFWESKAEWYQNGTNSVKCDEYPER